MQKAIAIVTILLGAAMMFAGWYGHGTESEANLPLLIGGFLVALIGGVAKAGAEMPYR